MTDSDQPVPASKLPMVIMGAVVAVVVLVIIALILSRRPTSYRPDSAEAALQAFITAGLDDDRESMLSLLSDEARVACAPVADDLADGDDQDRGLITELESMDVVGDRASAVVRFRQTDSDPFDSYSWNYDNKFTLMRTDRGWVIDRAGWPGRFQDCTNENR